MSLYDYSVCKDMSPPRFPDSSFNLKKPFSSILQSCAFLSSYSILVDSVGPQIPNMQNREANRMRAKFRYQPHVLVDVPSVLEFVSVLRPTKSRTRVEKSYLKLLAGCHIRGCSRNTVSQNTRNNTSTDKFATESIAHESVGFQKNNAGVQTLFWFAGYAGIPDTDTIIQRWFIAEVCRTETTRGSDVY